MDVVLCAAVWQLARMLGGDGAVRVAAAFYWCNPAILLVGAVLGYLDTWTGALALAGTLAASAGVGWATGVLLALACLTKAQSVFVVPAAVCVVVEDSSP